MGPKLLPLLQGGAEGLVQFREEAEELGIIIGQDAADAAADFGDAVDELQKAGGSLTNEIGMALVPVLTILARQAIPFVREGVKLVAPLFTIAGKAVGFLVGGLLDMATAIVQVVRPIIEPFISVLGFFADAISDLTGQTNRIDVEVDGEEELSAVQKTLAAGFPDTSVNVTFDTDSLIMDTQLAVTGANREIDNIGGQTTRLTLQDNVERLNAALYTLQTSADVTKEDVNAILSEIGKIEAAVILENLDPTTQAYYDKWVAASTQTAQRVRQQLLSAFDIFGQDPAVLPTQLSGFGDLSGAFTRGGAEATNIAAVVSRETGVDVPVDNYISQHNPAFAAELARLRAANQRATAAPYTNSLAPGQSPYRDLGPYVDPAFGGSSRQFMSGGQGSMGYTQAAADPVTLQIETVVGTDGVSLAEQMT